MMADGLTRLLRSFEIPIRSYPLSANSSGDLAARPGYCARRVALQRSEDAAPGARVGSVARLLSRSLDAAG